MDRDEMKAMIDDVRAKLGDAADAVDEFWKAVEHLQESADNDAAEIRRLDAEIARRTGE